jgi:hypothetical protein
MNAPANSDRIILYPQPAPAAGPEKTVAMANAGNFPKNAFRPPLLCVAEELAQIYQTPFCLPAMATLAVVSGAVGSSVVVHGAYKDKETRLNLYTIAVAERGSGKGNIGERLMRPIIVRSQEIERRHADELAKLRAEEKVLQREIRILETKPGAGRRDSQKLKDELAEKYRRQDEIKTACKIHKALWISDATGEAMGRCLADNNEALFSYSAEAGGLAKVALGRYAPDGDFEILLSAYSGDMVRVNRIHRDAVVLNGPCLSLFWLVQDWIIQGLVSHPEAIARGLMARPLVFRSEAKREYDDRKMVSFTQEKSWGELLNRILDAREEAINPNVLGCDPDAREVFAQFHDESVDLERGEFSEFKGELSRWRENAIKVAGLLAVAEGSPVITAELATRAVEVVRWCGLNYMSILQGCRPERLRRDLERVEALLSDVGGEMNLGPLLRDHNLDREKIEALVSAYPERLRLERRAHDGPGRPAEVLILITKTT